MSMNKLAIFLTLYERFENLDLTIRSLKNQLNKDFDLFIVNNSDRDIEDLVDIDCEIINMRNKYNIYGRFFAVRDVIDRGYEIIAFMDDDIIFPPTYTKLCYAHYEPEYVKSFWSFQIAGDYWTRKKLSGVKNGHYAGAGGLLAPAELFRVPQIYECPEEYWIMDDIWMSHVVLAYTDYKIRYFPLPVRMLDDDKATYKKIRQQKSDMAKKYLIPFIGYK
jgi:glycosyltransferase involved in cell wall biosynthesis